jgi:hypothetical protein
VPTRWIGRKNLEHGDDGVGYYSHVQFNWKNKNSFPDCVCVSRNPPLVLLRWLKKKSYPNSMGNLLVTLFHAFCISLVPIERPASFFFFFFLNFRIFYIYFTYSFFPLFQNVSRQCKKCWNNQDVDALASLGCPAFLWRWILSRTF